MGTDGQTRAQEDMTSTKYAFHNFGKAGKGKGKVIPLQAQCGPEGRYRYTSTLP